MQLFDWGRDSISKYTIDLLTFPNIFLSKKPTALARKGGHQLRDTVMLMLFENQLRLLLVHLVGHSASL